jgi:hypothetical protein
MPGKPTLQLLLLLLARLSLCFLTLSHAQELDAEEDLMDPDLVPRNETTEEGTGDDGELLHPPRPKARCVFLLTLSYWHPKFLFRVYALNAYTTRSPVSALVARLSTQNCKNVPCFCYPSPLRVTGCITALGINALLWACIINESFETPSLLTEVTLRTNDENACRTHKSKFTLLKLRLVLFRSPRSWLLKLTSVPQNCSGSFEYKRPGVHRLPIKLPPNRVSLKDLFITRDNYIRLGLSGLQYPHSLPPNALAIASRYKWRTCAVVGNSGTLLDSHYGASIDKHDVVIRYVDAMIHTSVCPIIRDPENKKLLTLLEYRFTLTSNADDSGVQDINAFH